MSDRPRRTPKPKPTREELLAENKMLKRERSAANWASFGNNLLKYGTLSFWGWCFLQAIKALAGHTTIAHILISFFAHASVSETVAWILGASGIIYGINERRLRKNAVEHLHPRSKKLEGLIDARRSSSRLTSQGETNPRDVE